MRPHPMIVLNIGRQSAAQVMLIDNDNVIKTFAPDRANDPLDIWPAPGSEDTKLGVLMEPEVGHGEAEVYT